MKSITRRVGAGAILTLLGAGCASPARPAPPSVRVPIAERAPPPTSISGLPATSVPPGTPALAAPHPAIRRVFAPYLAPAQPDELDDDEAPSRPSVPEDTCRQLTGFAGSELTSCELVLLASRTAPCLIVLHDCGAHLCDADYFVWHGGANEPYHFETSGSTTVELSPDHRHLIVSELEYDEQPGPPARGRTYRIELASGQRAPFASCLGTVLSPRGRYYVCRDLAGRVLRFPAGGGALELLVAPEIPPDDAIKLGGAFDDYPAPVEFKDASTFMYTLELQSGRVLELAARFTE